MYDVYLIFRSITHGQTGRAVLRRAGIPSALVRSPARLSRNGCAYVLTLRRENWPAARAQLLEADRLPQSVWERGADGGFRRLDP